MGVIECAVVFCLFLITLLLTLFIYKRNCVRGNNVCVVVLGDIGRSPRTQYHAVALARAGYRVTLIGYMESNPIKDVGSNPSIIIMPIESVSTKNVTNGIAQISNYVYKTVLLALQLVRSFMFCIPSPEFILVQNPPSIPILPVVAIASIFYGCPLVIDWHNLGHSILALSLGKRHPFVRISAGIEYFIGRRVYLNICVTKAMSVHLKENGIELRQNHNTTVLYDRPYANFSRTNIKEKHKLFEKLKHSYNEFKCIDGTDGNLFTTSTYGAGTDVSVRSDRPAMVISSTSWTPDEDFSILLKAMAIYDAICSSNEYEGKLPKVLCVITGKGPLKSYYEEEIDKLNLQNVTFCTPWLETEEYPKLLGSADVGVSLHLSSSGLDLPMKVVDMFGCGLPVCAVSFGCLPELVDHGRNGLVFRESAQLAEQLVDLLAGFPVETSSLLEELGHGVRSSSWSDWLSEWDAVVRPMLPPPGPKLSR